MTNLPARPDHAVINVLYDMDAAVERFRSMGFTVTPRGYHSLGSINHLMVFGNDYLELVGVERGANPIRREVAEAPAGLNGLVFRTFDADACHAALAERGIAAEAPLAFSRPIEIGGREELARFRTVRLKPGAMRGGRVYFCEHLTPQFVWRPEWQSHANGVNRIAGFTFVLPDPQSEASTYASMFDAKVHRLDGETYAVDADWLRIRFTTRARHSQRYGSLAGSPASDSYMAVLTLRTSAAANAYALPGSMSLPTEPGTRIVPASEAFGSMLEFVG